MIKEYINKLSDENKQDLDKLEKQMKDLLQELSCAEEWSESLQIKNNSQRNIFSPRNVDTELESKIEKNQLSIQKIRKEIEYVRDLIETHVKKKEEYEKLLDEIDDSEKKNKHDNSEQVKTTDDPLQQELSKEYFLSIFSEIYSKTERCLALLNSDKNRCKKELIEIKTKIKKCAEEMQTI